MAIWGPGLPSRRLAAPPGGFEKDTFSDVRASAFVFFVVFCFFSVVALGFRGFRVFLGVVQGFLGGF